MDTKGEEQIAALKFAAEADCVEIMRILKAKGAGESAGQGPDRG